MMTRVVFMGSPEFAVPSLRALTREYEVVGVVTQPDRPAGRGRELKEPAVKHEARKAAFPVIQPVKLTDPSALQQLRSWAPEVIVVAAFGQILRPAVLELPPHGCINVHASLLPRWRGAAPIQAAIAAGDEETGVTIMKMDEGLDTGEIILQRTVPILPTDTGGTLTGKLANLGAEALLLALPGYLSGASMPIAQDDSRATKAPRLKKEDGLLDPSVPAEELERQVRAFNPWPGAHLLWEGEMVKIHRAHIETQDAATGKRAVMNGMPAIGTAEGSLILDEVQPAGGKRMSGEAFILGARGWAS